MSSDFCPQWGWDWAKFVQIEIIFPEKDWAKFDQSRSQGGHKFELAQSFSSMPSESTLILIYIGRKKCGKQMEYRMKLLGFQLFFLVLFRLFVIKLLWLLLIFLPWGSCTTFISIFFCSLLIKISQFIETSEENVSSVLACFCNSCRKIAETHIVTFPVSLPSNPDDDRDDELANEGKMDFFGRRVSGPASIWPLGCRRLVGRRKKGHTLTTT